jgi:hypothetical protein
VGCRFASNLTFFPVRTANWQTINLASMQFPALMQIDYVRVYQRKGSHNIGCNPQNYPTADYINRHLDAYTSFVPFSVSVCLVADAVVQILI